MSDAKHAPTDARTTPEVIAFIEQHARGGIGYTALWRGAIERLRAHDALVARVTTLEASLADTCVALTGDPLLGQRLNIELANTVRSVAHQELAKLLARASEDATKLEAKCDALVAALNDADKLIEEWIGILCENGLRCSAVDGEAVRAKIAALKLVRGEGGGES